MKNQIEDTAKDDCDYKIECVAFLMLSGKLGRTFLDTPKRKRKIEDYGKLIGICIVFEFKQILLRLCKEGKSNLEEIIEYLQEEGEKALTVEGWVKEAIDNIFDEQLKKEATKIWETKKQLLNGESFDIAKMF